MRNRFLKEKRYEKRKQQRVLNRVRNKKAKKIL